MIWTVPDTARTLTGTVPGSSGVVVRLTPSLDAPGAGPPDDEARAEGGTSAGRYLASAWTRDGTPIFLGRPVAVDADLGWAWAADLFPSIRFVGPNDPGADAGLATQSVRIEVGVPDTAR